MKRKQPVSIFLSKWMMFAGLAVLCLLASPSRSQAQDAGVSGIAPGPANARGLNGSVSDPSGIGNAARVPAIPPPSMAPVLPPTASPSVAYRPGPMLRSGKTRRTRYTAYRYRRSANREIANRAAVKENDRLIDRKLLSICRGC